MDVDDLPDADRLWWPFAVLVADAVGRGTPGWSYDATEHVLRHDDPDGTRLRMQRLYGGRSVLWGSVPGVDPRVTWTGIPGWATSDEVRRHLGDTTFVAWHSRHGWDSATQDADLAPALAPVLDADLPPGLVEASGAGTARIEDLDPGIADREAALAVLRAAASEATLTQGAVRSLLAGEIHEQMRRTRDRDRLLPQRPALLVRWARVADLPPGFHYALHLQGDDLVPAIGNHEVAAPFRVTLRNVLDRLHRDEADPDSGRWLFARVRYDGVNVHFDRTFDSRPPWYEDDGPTLETLAVEMSRRTPEWRPAWSRLLPRVDQLAR